MNKILFIICLLFLFQAGFTAKTVVLADLEKPSYLEVNDDYIYFKDGWSIKIYSLKDFNLVRTVGQHGEGPGEFSGSLMYCLTPGYLFCDTTGRAVYFTLKGDFIKQKVTAASYKRFKPFGNNKFIGYHFTIEKKQRMESIKLYNSEFKAEKLLYRRSGCIDQNMKINLIHERPPYFKIYKDKAYVETVNGEFLVVDVNGNVIKTLKPSIQPVPFTSLHKKKFIESFTQSKDYRRRRFYKHNKELLVYPDFFPPMRMFHISDDKIFIMTYTEKNGNNEILVTNLDGKEIKRVLLPISPVLSSAYVLNYGISNGKLYHLKDNPDTEEWELHIHQLNLD